MEPVFVYVTCQDRTEALQLAKAVVQARLAACANGNRTTIPPVKSNTRS